MRFRVDPWDAAYGASVEVDLTPSEIDVHAEVERLAADWCPVPPTADARAPGTVLFVDGVRRVDARVWIDAPAGDDALPGICASYAAGVVRCAESARLVASVVTRGMFSAADATDIATRHGTYVARVATGSDPEALWLALQDQMARREVEMAEAARREVPPDADALLVVDGPLSGRSHVPGAIGMVKTHNVSYLPPELHRVVGRLGPAERTPLFTLGGRWSRHSWYLRLPGSPDAPWAGVVRCECSADLPVADAVALAGSVAVTLPRFASHAHKDARAPQNLYPIGGLERELRRRLGDPELLYRALRVASKP